MNKEEVKIRLSDLINRYNDALQNSLYSPLKSE